MDGDHKDMYASPKAGKCHEIEYVLFVFQEWNVCIEARNWSSRWCSCQESFMPLHAALFKRWFSFNGYYGCSTCYIRGESADNLKGTKTRTYPLDTSEKFSSKGHPELRSHAETLAHANMAEEVKKPYLGVKGTALIAMVPKFDLIRGVRVDYMHIVTHGVVKMRLDLWTNNDFKNMNCYVGHEIDEMNSPLAAVKSPSRITRLPRKIEHLAHWKASELRAFLLFYSIPVLDGILPLNHFDHFMLLVNGISILLQGKILPSDLLSAEDSIRQFCLMMDFLYNPSMEKSNVHALLHLPDKVRDLGPLWAHSCFFYEDLNGDLRSLIHGTASAAIGRYSMLYVYSKNSQGWVVTFIRIRCWDTL